MGDQVKLGFEKADNPLAYGLYEGLAKKGVKDKQLDHGYSLVNYANKHCPSPGPDMCIVGQKDGTISPEEVFEYALADYAKYRNLIEGTVGHPLPWVLSDSNPDTEDAKLREEIRGAIDELKSTLKLNGLKPKSKKYEEAMAVGLFYFLAWNLLKLKGSKIDLTGRITDEFDALGLDGYDEFVEKYNVDNIGLFMLDDNHEYTATEAFDEGRGNCTELSYMLLSVFRMAGLDPRFISVRLTEKDPFYEGIPEEFRKGPLEHRLNFIKGNPGLNHKCVGIDFGGGMRLFDLTDMSADVSFVEHYVISLRHELSDYIFELGKNLPRKYSMKEDHELENAQWNKALLVDPMNPEPYNSLGTNFGQAEEYAKAMAMFDQALDIYSNMPFPYLGKGSAYLGQGKLEEAAQNYIKYIQSGALNYYKIMIDLIELYCEPKWKGDPLEKAMPLNTNSQAPGTDAMFIYMGILWQSGLKEAAIEELESAADFIEMKKKDPSIAAFFESLICTLPPEMLKDPASIKAICKLRKKLK